MTDAELDRLTRLAEIIGYLEGELMGIRLTLRYTPADKIDTATKIKICKHITGALTTASTMHEEL